MKFLQYILIAVLIGIFLLQLGCRRKNKWNAVPLKINKQESYNYSEMISGKLDSTTKAELEEVKKVVSLEKENIQKNFKEGPAERDSKNTTIIGTIIEGINNIYNWFLDLF